MRCAIQYYKNILVKRLLIYFVRDGDSATLMYWPEDIRDDDVATEPTRSSWEQ